MSHGEPSRTESTGSPFVAFQTPSGPDNASSVTASEQDRRDSASQVPLASSSTWLIDSAAEEGGMGGSEYSKNSKESFSCSEAAKSLKRL
jgi:hypothetical protein